MHSGSMAWPKRCANRIVASRPVDSCSTVRSTAAVALEEESPTPKPGVGSLLVLWVIHGRWLAGWLPGWCASRTLQDGPRRQQSGNGARKCLERVLPHETQSQQNDPRYSLLQAMGGYPATYVDLIRGVIRRDRVRVSSREKDVQHGLGIAARRLFRRLMRTWLAGLVFPLVVRGHVMLNLRRPPRCRP